MKLLKLFKRKQKKEISLSDYYQITLEKFGKEQLRRLAEKGLHIPIRAI